MKNDDMPAMPQAVAASPSGDVYQSYEAGGMGLTKREAFAMAAMQGLLANSYLHRTQNMSPSTVSRVATEYANAQLAALEQEQ